MKICFISNLYAPHIIGGAEISVQRVAEKLLKRGHKVFVITTSVNGRNSAEEINGVKVYRVNPLNLYAFYNYQNKSDIQKAIWHIIDIWNPSSYINVKDILKKESPDVVHINNFKGLSTSIFAAIKHLNIPLVFNAHDCSLICPRTNLLHGDGEICTNPNKFCILYGKIEKYFVEDKVDLVIAPSNFVINKLKSFGLFKNIKTMKIPLGIEMTTKKSKKTYDTVDILYAGDLGKHKGVHILINAFKMLKNENLQLHIMGKGNDEDEFKKIAKSDQRIIFHGFIDWKKLMKFYQKANIAVLPSICYDNSPLMIYESLTNGTPLVGSRIGGIPELIEERYNGFLFEAGNVDELKEILEKLINNPSKLKKLEEGALESVQQYSMKNYIEKLERIYKDLL